MSEIPAGPNPNPLEGPKRERARTSLVLGDITARSADALLTPVNSDGVWAGAVDRALMRRYGPGFHQRLSQKGNARGLSEGEVVYVPTDLVAGLQAEPPFTGVAFVVDDLNQGLDQLVFGALTELNNHAFKPRKVTIPLMRTGVMAGMYKSPMEAIAQLGAGIERFVSTSQFPNVQEIEVVVYPGSFNPEDLGKIGETLAGRTSASE